MVRFLSRLRYSFNQQHFTIKTINVNAVNPDVAVRRQHQQHYQQRAITAATKNVSFIVCHVVCTVRVKPVPGKSTLTSTLF